MERNLAIFLFLLRLPAMIKHYPRIMRGKAGFPTFTAPVTTICIDAIHPLFKLKIRFKLRWIKLKYDMLKIPAELVYKGKLRQFGKDKK